MGSEQMHSECTIEETVSYEDLETLYSQSPNSEEFREKLDTFVEQEYQKQLKKILSKIEIREMNSFALFKNCKIVIRGETFYLSTEVYPGPPPGEVKNDKNGRTLIVTHPHNRNHHNAARIEGLFSPDNPKRMRHLVYDRISSNAIRSVKSVGIEPKGIYIFEDQLEIFNSFLLGIFKSLKPFLEDGTSFGNFRNYIHKGRNTPIIKTEGKSPNILAGPPGSGKTLQTKTEPQFNTTKPGKVSRKIVYDPVLTSKSEIKKFVLELLNNPDVNISSLTSFVQRQIIINGIPLNDSEPKPTMLYIFENLKQRVGFGASSLMNDIEMLEAANHLLKQPLLKINSWIRYLAEFVVYSGIEVGGEIFQTIWEPKLNRVINLLLTIFPDNKFQINTEIFELDENELKRRPTASLSREEFVSFYVWLKNNFKVNHQNRIVEDLGGNPDIDIKELMESFYSIAIDEGIPNFKKILKLDGIFKRLDEQSRELGLNVFEQNAAINMAAYFLKMLPSKEQDKVMLPFFEILRLEYSEEIERFKLVGEINKMTKKDFTEMIDRLGNSLSIFGPALPNVLHFIETNFEFIRLCAIAELRMVNVLASSENRQQQLKYHLGEMDLNIEL